MVATSPKALKSVYEAVWRTGLVAPVSYAGIADALSIRKTGKQVYGSYVACIDRQWTTILRLRTPTTLRCDAGSYLRMLEHGLLRQIHFVRTKKFTKRVALRFYFDPCQHQQLPSKDLWKSRAKWCPERGGDVGCRRNPARLTTQVGGWFLSQGSWGRRTAQTASRLRHGRPSPSAPNPLYSLQDQKAGQPLVWG